MCCCWLWTTSLFMMYEDSLGGSAKADWSKMVVNWSALGSTAILGSKSRSMGKEKLKSAPRSIFWSCCAAHWESCDQSGWDAGSKVDSACAWACAAMVWSRNSSVSLGSVLSSAWGVVGDGEFVEDELELSEGGGVDMVAGGKESV